MMTRVKNEARWLEEVIRAALPVCHRVFVMDDHSTDDTVGVLERMREPKIIVLRSPFGGRLDEAADKNYLYRAVLNHPEYQADQAGYHWPEWILAIDGDEILDSRDVPLLREMLNEPYDHEAAARAKPEDGMIEVGHVGWKFKIVYLWNDRRHRRVDGCYATFSRPSLFRVLNPSFTFLSTPYGVCPETGGPANFHCSSVPQELLYRCYESEVRLNHLGYMHVEDRLRKWAWYQKVDKDCVHEDNYRHMVAGDVPEVPAEMKTMHAGPLTLVEVD